MTQMSEELYDEALHVLRFYRDSDQDGRFASWADALQTDEVLSEEKLVEQLLLAALDGLTRVSDRNDRCTRVLVDNDTNEPFCGFCREVITGSQWRAGLAAAPLNFEDNPADRRFWFPCPHCGTSLMSPEVFASVQRDDRL